jgi:protein TonB
MSNVRRRISNMQRVTFAALALVFCVMAAAQEKSTAVAASSDRRVQLEKQLEEIQRQIEKETGGRVRYVSPSTKDEPFKSYYERVAARAANSGTADPPKRDGKSVYGKVAMQVRVQSTGRLMGLEVLKADEALLANHAKSLIRRLQPFEAFSPEMGKVKEMVLLLQFTYTNE